VLDFALAKAMENAPGAATLYNSPALLSVAATNGGMILGTAGYMSPEQVSQGIFRVALDGGSKPLNNCLGATIG
jgi:hypothetical protein